MRRRATSSGTSLAAPNVSSPAAIGRRPRAEVGRNAIRSSQSINRFRLRVLSGGKDEFLLTAIAQNLRELAKLDHPQPASEVSGVA